MSSSNDPRVDESVAAYADLHPLYQRFCSKTKGLLEDLLAASNIKYQVVEARAKTVESFAEKIQREGKNYKNPLSDISDLAGIRIILYYNDDVDRACDLIEQQFVVDPLRSSDKRDVLAPDQFGYLSVHKIATLSTSRVALPEWM